MGYSGGTTSHPTYRDIGDHAETIQIEYDPKQISYSQLLDVFWKSQNPASRPWSTQYASMIFYHNEEQKQLALETKDREEARYGKPIYTEIVPFSRFYLAEWYHQKYRLQQTEELVAQLQNIYPTTSSLLSSTLAARINGLLGGHGTLTDVEALLHGLNLSHEDSTRLMETLSSYVH